MNTNKLIFFKDLGCRDYKEIWDYQKLIYKDIYNIKYENRNLSLKDKKRTPNYLLFVEHPHVYTLGKNGDYKNLLLSKKELEEIGILFYRVDRGGDITYHGPGQIIVYPILDLENFFIDIHKYIRFLEKIVIKVIEKYGVKCKLIKGKTGVWTVIKNDNKKIKKICSIGIRVSRWITMHGFALNINTNLKYFRYIIPCGMNIPMTSLKNELKYYIPIDNVKFMIKKYFQKLFECKLFDS